MRSALTPLLFLTIACSGNAVPEDVRPTKQKIAAELPSRSPEWQDPSCASGRFGEYQNGPGNSHVRYADVCIDKVSVQFVATPEFMLSFSINPRHCQNGKLADASWSAPEGFFLRPISEQISTVEVALRSKMNTVAAACSFTLDSNPILGQRFADFYRDYGDGWWFDRRASDFVLTPERGSRYQNAQTH